MNRPNKKEVSLVISQLKRLGVVKEKIAVELKVSAVSVDNWAKGKSSPNWPTYDALLTMLHKTKKKG